MAYLRLISHLLGCAVILAAVLKVTTCHPNHVLSILTPGCTSTFGEERIKMTSSTQKHLADIAALEKNGCTCQHHGERTQCTCNGCLDESSESEPEYSTFITRPAHVVSHPLNHRVSAPQTPSSNHKFIKPYENSNDESRRWFGQGDAKYYVPAQGDRQQKENDEHMKAKRNVGNIRLSEDGSDESDYVSIGRLDANDLHDRQKRETFYVDPALINNDYQYNQKGNEYFGPTQVNPEVQFAKRESEYYARPVQANNDYQYNQNGNEYFGQAQANPEFQFSKRESEYANQAQVNNDYQYNARHEGVRALEPDDGYQLNKRGIDNVNPAQQTGEYQYNKRYDNFIESVKINNDYQNKRNTEYYKQPNQVNSENPSSQVRNEYEFNKRNVPVLYIEPEETNAQYQYHKRDTECTVQPQANREYQHNKRNVHVPKPEGGKLAYRAKKRDTQHVNKDQKRKYRNSLGDGEFIEPASMRKCCAFKRDTEYANAGGLSGEQPGNTEDSVVVPAQGDTKNVDKDGAVVTTEGTTTPDEDLNKTEEAHKGKKKHKKKKHSNKRGKKKQEEEQEDEVKEENEENEEQESAATEDVE